MNKHIQVFFSFGLIALGVLVLGTALFIDDSTRRVVVADPEVFLTSHDTPGDGFDVGDDCGFVTGASEIYNDAQVLADAVLDRNQLCFDENGYARKDATHESRLRHSSLGAFSFDWHGDSADYVRVDQTTGLWYGTAAFRSTQIPLAERGILFDFTDPNFQDYRVTTNLDTGVISGYAWNDYLDRTTGDGWISFNAIESVALTTELTAELPPRDIQIYVDLLASDTLLGPSDVSLATAPLADATDYWRARVQFWDSNRGEFLDEDDISFLAITLVPTAESNIYLDQVKNKMDAVTIEHENPSIPDCYSLTTSYCVQTEEDTSTSFNVYAYSGGPSSIYTGMDDDSDDVIEYNTDRDGCVKIYDDRAGELGYGTSCTGFTKDDVYYERETDRNFLEVDYVTVEVVFAGSQSSEVYTYDDTDSGGSAVSLVNENVWRYTPASADVELKFAPRFRVQKFVAEYDGEEYTTISDDTLEDMILRTEATVEDPSAAMVSAYEMQYGSTPIFGFEVHYQMDNDSDTVDLQSPDGDMYLLIDSDDPTDGTADDTTRLDDIPKTSFMRDYNRDYDMAYGQKEDECITTDEFGEEVNICSESTNTVSNPTAEQWVCDDVTEYRMSYPSCYYTAYLPIQDRHVDPPEGMTVIGAINSAIDENDFFATDTENISLLGSVNIITLRNKMYAQLARYILGQSTTGGTLDSNLEPASTSGIVELMNGRLLYATGGVTISGSSSHADKVLFVKDGNVYIDGDITGGKFGIIAFGSESNVFVHPDVKNIHANIQIDGMFTSYSGTKDGGEFEFGGEDARIELLLHQLYLKGSLVSRNTIGGSDNLTALGYAQGDGTFSFDEEMAINADLDKTRQRRLCYPLTASGTVDTGGTPEDCNEGEELSDYVDADGLPVDDSFIIEYDPPGDLPIFTVESGFFY